MAYRVLLGVADDLLARDFAALASEAGDIEIVATAANAGDLIATLQTTELDVIVVHEHLGPLPVLDLARDLAARTPEIGVVLLARESAAVPAAVARAGVRGIVGLPLSLENLSLTVSDAGSWAQAVRARFERVDSEDSGGGRMLVVAGAKGGVGTTTIAVHLALAATQSVPPRSVCLIDFDLQKGDVRSFLDLTHRRSVIDLVDVADDLTGRQIDESLYVHASGMRVLLPPLEGEFAETIAAEAARRILGGIRSRFDVVVVDVGAVVTEGAAVAAEMADQVVVVVTPDIPCLRGANRLLGLWERLQVRKEGIGILVNQASRDSEIQPELVGKVVGTSVLRTSLPADFRMLEAAGNTGVPDRLEEGRLRRSLNQLAEELALVSARRRTGGRGFLRSQEGQVMADFIASFFVIVFVLILLWQLALAGFTVVLAHHAAREAVREVAVGAGAGELESVVREDLPPGWNRADAIDISSGSDSVTVTLTVPALLPNLLSPLTITVREGTVRETALEHEREAA